MTNTSQSQNESQSAVEIGLVEPSLGTEEEPKKRRGRQPGSVSKAAQSETLKRIETGVSGMLQGAALIMQMTPGKLANDGAILASHEKNITASIVELCRQDKKARELFISLTTSSAYAGVVIACIPVVIAVLANHNLLPPIFGLTASVPVQEQASPNVNGRV